MVEVGELEVGSGSGSEVVSAQKGVGVATGLDTGLGGGGVADRSSNHGGGAGGGRVNRGRDIHW